eukprot:8513680-Lingulodinium_polyedra.AAC.1
MHDICINYYVPSTRFYAGLHAASPSTVEYTHAQYRLSAPSCAQMLAQMHFASLFRLLYTVIMQACMQGGRHA